MLKGDGRSEPVTRNMVSVLSARGDLLCPACGGYITTHPLMDVQPGDGTCPICREPFTLTADVAAKSNDLARLTEERYGRSDNWE